MPPPISEKNHWQNIFRRQNQANIIRWLGILRHSDSPVDVIINDYDNLLRALESALNDPEQFEDLYELIQALYPHVFNFGDWERWLNYLHKALTTARETDRKNESARLLEQVGDIIFSRGDLDEAGLLYSQSLDMYKEIGNRSKQTDVLNKLALGLNSQGKPNEAIALCQQALNLAREINDKEVIAHIQLGASNIFRQMRDWQTALEMAAAAHDYYFEIGKTVFASRALLNMVHFWAELGEWEQVNTTAPKLIDTLEAIGDTRTLIQLKNNLGISAFYQQNYGEAEKYWHEASLHYSQLQEPAGEADIFNNLGKLYTEMKEWSAAEDMLNKAISLFEGLGDPFMWANSIDNLADLFENQGKINSCREILRRGIAGLEGKSDSPSALELLDSMKRRLENLPPN